MVLQSKYCFGVVGNTTVEISKETLASMPGLVESELYSSEVYQLTLAGLETMLGEAAASAQLLIKAVGREAIRLALGQFGKYCKVVPALGSNESESCTQHSPIEATPEFNPDNLESEAIATADNSENPAKLPAPTLTPPAFTKPTETELAQQIVDREREKCLRQIGQKLQQARQAQSLTIIQLYDRTLVPPSHIKALETGCIKELPEDVYIRGFIRMLGDALGLDGADIAASLPTLDPVRSVVPSWYRSRSTAAGFNLSPIHLYVGYAALVAGAIGGLSWMSQRSTGSVENNPLPSPHSSLSKPPQSEETTAKPGLKHTRGVAIGADIAPPEFISTHR